MSVAELPAASRAVTTMTFDPLCNTMPLTLQLVVPVAVPLPPRSLAHVTCVTPTASLAEPPTVNGVVLVVKVVPDVGVPIEIAGAVVSAGVNVTVSESVRVLFAASRAVTVMTFAPLCKVMPATLQLVVPVAVPLPPRSFVHVTCVTPTASAAVPPTVSVAELVAKVVDVVGVAMEIVGAVVSPAATVHVNVCEAVSTPSDTVAVTEYVPLVVGVPEMNPVVAPRLSPGGRPVAEYVTARPSGSDPTSCSEPVCPAVPDCAPGLVSVGRRLLYPQTSEDFAPSTGPAAYADTAKQYSAPGTAVVKL